MGNLPPRPLPPSFRCVYYSGIWRIIISSNPLFELTILNGMKKAQVERNWHQQVGLLTSIDSSDDSTVVTFFIVCTMVARNVLKPFCSQHCNRYIVNVLWGPWYKSAHTWSTWLYIVHVGVSLRYNMYTYNEPLRKMSRAGSRHVMITCSLLV